jgi:hypothetical protein
VLRARSGDRDDGQVLRVTSRARGAARG